MLDMSGDRKKAACKQFDSFESQLGTAGVGELLECSSVYKAAHLKAKAFCAAGDAPNHRIKTTPAAKTTPGGDAGQTCNAVICNIAKAQVFFFVFVFCFLFFVFVFVCVYMCVYVCVTADMTCDGAGKYIVLSGWGFERMGRFGALTNHFMCFIAVIFIFLFLFYTGQESFSFVAHVW